MMNKQIKTAGLVVFMLMLVLAAVSCAPPSGTYQMSLENFSQSGGITVVGTGEASGKPDLARVSAGVETFAETVGEAVIANDATMQKIISTLEELGIDEKDIQTANYNLWAEENYENRETIVIRGYRVSNVVRVTVRDIEQVSDVIGAVTEAGANSIHGVSFEVDDTDKLEEDARKAAVEDAKARAEALAESSGVKLGEVISVTEVVGSTPYQRGFGGGDFAVAEEMAAGPSISPGQLSFVMQVQVTFAIE